MVFDRRAQTPYTFIWPLSTLQELVMLDGGNASYYEVAARIWREHGLAGFFAGGYAFTWMAGASILSSVLCDWASGALAEDNLRPLPARWMTRARLSLADVQ